jgi:transcriptional regulator GlxA family with amidase domain
MTARFSGPPADPFLRRVLLVIDKCIEAEWTQQNAARNEAAALGWTTERRDAYRALHLTPERLAKLVDGMSEAKLRRALLALGAPPPGELIRKARIRYAAKLLTHTRLLVKQVAERAGYRSEKHFTDVFRATFDTTPTDYRRTFIQNQDTQGDPHQ